MRNRNIYLQTRLNTTVIVAVDTLGIQTTVVGGNGPESSAGVLELNTQGGEVVH